MHLVPVVVVILVGLSTALVCVRRSKFGSEMERSFEMLKSRGHVAPLEAPMQARLANTVSIHMGTISPDTRGIALPVESSPQLPRAS